MITVEQAMEAAQRLVNGAFRRDGEQLPSDKRPRFSIPAQPDHDDDLVLMAFLRSVATPAGEDVGKWLRKEDVEWVVNDIAELGVKIGNQFFFCYKGGSLVYEDAAHDDGTPMHWRPVFKREFGECIHPINYKDPTLIGTVSLEDSDEWQPLPGATPLPASTPEPDAVRIAGEAEPR